MYLSELRGGKAYNRNSVHLGCASRRVVGLCEEFRPGSALDLVIEVKRGAHR